ncbi:unnamed protein product [marine sediment metagenome]|uniref:Uncharacterized protein n=1 Tax=marine sediment metagenome TaxID=412755 RepID=X0SD14_9ZZZZ
MDYPLEVERAGGVPLVLPWTKDETVLAAALERVDGLLLSGGGDIAALAYGEEPHPRNRYEDPVRDAAEFAAIKLALKRKLPILGICRGIQSLNVALGGTLVQDVPSQVTGAVQHYTYERETVLNHTIDIAKATLLHKLMGKTSMPVNSWHHQAVGKLGKGLKVNAKARDGVIEGVEAADKQAILALQCHPEDCAEDYPVFQKLFEWLVSAAR